MRPLADIAADLLKCASEWEPQSRLIGNVRADEIAELARRFAAAEAVIEVLSAIAYATSIETLHQGGHTEDHGLAIGLLKDVNRKARATLLAYQSERAKGERGAT